MSEKSIHHREAELAGFAFGNAVYGDSRVSKEVYGNLVGIANEDMTMSDATWTVFQDWDPNSENYLSLPNPTLIGMRRELLEEYDRHPEFLQPPPSKSIGTGSVCDVYRVGNYAMKRLHGRRFDDHNYNIDVTVVPHLLVKGNGDFEQIEALSFQNRQLVTQFAGESLDKSHSYLDASPNACRKLLDAIKTAAKLEVDADIRHENVFYDSNTDHFVIGDLMFRDECNLNGIEYFDHHIEYKTEDIIRAINDIMEHKIK